MLTPHSLLARMILVGLMVLAAAAVCGQGYPNKPIRIITAEVGGSTDMHARGIAPGLREILGQPVIIDNRGGNGVIPIDLLVKATPDGYTLLVYGSATWLLPFMQSVSYDPLKDIAPIIMMTTAPAVVVVNSSLPVKSMSELIAMAKAQPGKLNYGAGIAGSLTHLTVELFKAMAGVNLVPIFYKGGALSVNALLSGEVQVVFAGGTAAAPLVSSGRLRALAVTSAQPSILFPGVPTIAAEGLPGYEGGAVQGVFAPAKTPATLIKRLNNEIVKVFNTPEVRERFIKSGSEVVAGTPEQFVTYIKADMASMGKAIKDAGIRVQ